MYSTKNRRDRIYNERKTKAVTTPLPFSHGKCPQNNRSETKWYDRLPIHMTDIST